MLRTSDLSANNEIQESLSTLTQSGYKELREAIYRSSKIPVEQQYRKNETFKRIVTEESERIIQLINNILKNQGIDGNMRNKGVYETMEFIIEVNDSILDKVNDNINIMTNIGRPTLDQIGTQPGKLGSGINGSWNVNKMSFANPVIKSSPSATFKARGNFRFDKVLKKPQLEFKQKVDNGNYPWEPRIKDKPNSIKPLAIFLEETEHGESYTHPYEMELNHFESTEEQLQRSINIPKPRKVSETPLNEITMEEQLQKLVDELRKHPVIAIDLEHHSYRSFMGITCLMQISTVNDDYIIDTLKLRDDLHVLNEVFTNPKIVKVFHGAIFDIQWLQRDLSLYIVNMFDTHQAAKQLGYSGLSLAYLLNKFCRVDPNKKFQLADWRIRPLPGELLHYAREDTHYLIYIYHMLKNELIDKANGNDNILRAVIQRSTEVCKRRYFKPILTEESHLDFYRTCKRSFNNRQMYALKRLYQWRDKVAREEDESLGYVLPNHMMMQIAEILPKQVQGISACCNPIPQLVTSSLAELHSIILEARNQPIEKPIMREDNSERGSVKQTSMIDIDNNLYCPHDLSKNMDFRDDLSTLLDKKLENINAEGMVNKIAVANIALEKNIPRLPFDVTNDINKNDMDALMKLKNLKFLGPFDRYRLVRPFAQDEAKKISEEMEMKEENNEDKSVEDRINSLHEHLQNISNEPQNKDDSDVELLEEQKSPNPPTCNAVKKRKWYDDTWSTENNQVKENCPVTLRHMGARKKISNTKFEGFTVDVDESHKNQLHTPKPSVGCTNKRKFQDVNDTSVSQDTICKQHKQKRRKKAVRNENNQVVSSVGNFKPFDYSSVDYSKFQGGSKVNQSQPGASNMDSKFKRKRRNRNRNKGVNKSSTFNVQRK